MQADTPLIEDPKADPAQIVRRFRLYVGNGTWLSLNLCLHHAGGGLEPATDENLHALRHALEAYLPPHLQTPIDPAAPIPATAELPTAAEEDWGIPLPDAEPVRVLISQPPLAAVTQQDLRTIAEALATLKKLARPA